MESAIQCSYIGCDKPLRKGQRFHYLPARNAGLCVKWLINSGREDLLTYESNILESMKLAFCDEHFNDHDYNNRGDLKEATVPIQYWDLGYACELGEIKENVMKQRLGNNSEDSFTSTDSEGNDNHSEIDTDDEFRTQLGNEIEALLNSVQNSHGESKPKGKPGLGQTLKSFYRKLNIKGDRRRKIQTATGDLAGFRRATKNMCRTCAKKKTNLVDIAEKTGDSDIDIVTKLKLLIEIKDHDVFPAKICQQCLTKLEDSYKFFQQIYNADNILRDMLVDHKRTAKPSSNRRKYNGHIAKLKSLDIKREDDCLEVNDMPFKSNSLKRPWTLGSSLDNEDPDSYGIDENLRKIKKEKSNENDENTVSYLLSDFCNDAELNWLDVVGIMEKNNKPEPYAAENTNRTDEAPAASGPLRISCKYCDSTFRLRRQLKTHITVDHLQPTNYMCEHCSICCKSKEDLSQHQAQTHSSNIYKCDCCVETFEKKGDLRSHIKKIHSSDKNGIKTNENVSTTDTNDQTTVISDPDETFTCNDCEKVFSSKQTLSNHIHRLHPIFAYTCAICNKVTNSEAETYKHMTIHDKSPLFPCLDCGKMFYSTEKLEKHTSTHGKSSSKKRKRVWFHCQLCDASYRISDELIKHIETHSPEDWENYRNKILYCGECNARLIGKEKFLIHKMRYHLAKRGDFICLLCDDTPQDFKSLEEYEKHVNSHSNEIRRAAPRRFKCEHCDKAFKTNSHMINHVDSFHSDVTHTCPICDLKVKRKGNLKDHIDRVHNSKNKNQAGTVEVYLGDKRYPCRICGEKLLTTKQRNDHEDEHQEPCKDLEKMFPWTQRYSCDHCGMKFYYIHKLRKHLVDVHEDKEKAAIIETLEKNRKFRCTECEATFKHASGLDTHIKGIHSGAVHACPICGIKCKLASGLKKHLITHDENRLLYKCQHCDKQFKNDETRKNHESNHRSDDPKQFKEDVSNNDKE